MRLMGRRLKSDLSSNWSVSDKVLRRPERIEVPAFSLYKIIPSSLNWFNLLVRSYITINGGRSYTNEQISTFASNKA